MIPPAKLLPLLLAAIVVGTAGPAQARDRVEYFTRRPVIRGDTVFLTKQNLRSVWIPVSPEGAGWVPLDSIYQVFAVELGQPNSQRPVTSRVKVSWDREFRFATFDAKGRPAIREPAKLRAQLAAQAGITCDGTLSMDRQHSRVLYYECMEEGLFYRFTESASFPAGARPQEFRVGREFTHAGGRFAYPEIPFFSSGQDSKIYFMHDQEFFELDLSSGETGKTDVYAGFQRGLEMDASPRRIIGMTPKLRVVDSATDESFFAVHVLREGQPPQWHEFRDESLAVDVRMSGMVPIYFADQNLVLWQINEDKAARTTLAVLNLDSGQFRSTSFRH